MIDVFISYSHKDILYKDELEKHLTALKRSGLINTWTDVDVQTKWDLNLAIQERIDNADLIILLISPDLLASEFIYTFELEKLFLNDNKNILPVIVRPCAWQDIRNTEKKTSLSRKWQANYLI
jgi:hypothetical protein